VLQIATCLVVVFKKNAAGAWLFDEGEETPTAIQPVCAGITDCAYNEAANQVLAKLITASATAIRTNFLSIVSSWVLLEAVSHIWRPEYEPA
jgi:hypothetical protein